MANMLEFLQGLLTNPQEQSMFVDDPPTYLAMNEFDDMSGEDVVEAMAFVVESLPDLTATERQCRLDVIDTYSSDELEAIGKANEDETIEVQGDGTAEMQKFTADLGTCTASG